MKFIPLSFISSLNELKRQIINTVVFSDLVKKYPTVSLSSYLDGTQYGFTASAKESGDYKLVRITDINDGSVEWDSVPFCDCASADNYLLNNNDILVARTGGTTGKSFLVNDPPENAIYASYLIRLRAKQDVNPLFINAFLNSYNYWSQVAEAKSGAAQPNVNAEKLKKLLLPQCSIEVQREVVNLIHKGTSTIWPDIAGHINVTLQKFDRIKTLEAELQTQQTLLTQLRQAILQEAVQGKLTERWRAEREGLEPTETGSALLTRIRAEKAELIRQGKLRKEKPLPSITDAEKPFELLEGWVWCRLGDVAFDIFDGPFGSNLTTKDYVEQGVQVVRLENIGSMKFIESKTAFITEAKYHTLLKNTLQGGDILFSSFISDEVRACIFPQIRFTAINKADCFCIRLEHEFLLREYLLFCFSSRHTRLGLYHSVHGIARPRINLSQLRNIPIPLPPLAEQQAIVAQVERLLKKVSELEIENKQQQAEVGRLMQAVLREAFAGKEMVEIAE